MKDNDQQALGSGLSARLGGCELKDQIGEYMMRFHLNAWGENCGHIDAKHKQEAERKICIILGIEAFPPEWFLTSGRAPSKTKPHTITNPSKKSKC